MPIGLRFPETSPASTRMVGFRISTTLDNLLEELAKSTGKKKGALLEEAIQQLIGRYMTQSGMETDTR